jgi:hypothetical protein
MLAASLQLFSARPSRKGRVRLSTDYTQGKDSEIVAHTLPYASEEMNARFGYWWFAGTSDLMRCAS